MAATAALTRGTWSSNIFVPMPHEIVYASASATNWRRMDFALSHYMHMLHASLIKNVIIGYPE